MVNIQKRACYGMGWLAVLAFLAVIIMVPLGNAAAKEVYTLKLADYYPVGHPSYATQLALNKKIEQRSNGQIKIQYYPSEQLAKTKDLLKACQKGMADMVNIAVPYSAGNLPLSTVNILPHWTHGWEGTEIIRRLYDESPEIQEEFKKLGVQPIMLTGIPQYDIGTVSKPVRSPEDLKGLRLKVGGGAFTDIVKRYGVNPISIAAPETYEALQRGILDGALFSYGSVKGYRVYEVEKYHTLGLRMGGWNTLIVINSKSLNKLPKHLQQILLEEFKIYEKSVAEYWDRMNIDLSNQYEKEGYMKIYRAKPEDRAKWEAPLKGLDEEWAAGMEKRGLPGNAVLKQFNKICKEVVK